MEEGREQRPKRRHRHRRGANTREGCISTRTHTGFVDYAYFADEAQVSKEIEIVCHYPQFFATRMLTQESIFNALHSTGSNGKGGTYFEATGCGKTHTILFLAQQLVCRYTEKMGNSTVVIIVDRSALENQNGVLFCNAMTYLKDANIKVFESREDLRKELRTNLGGGLYVTTIQKFAEGEGMLSDRSNIVFLSDEAHRTQVSMGSRMTIRTKTDSKKEIADDKICAFFTETFVQLLHGALPNAITDTTVEETIQVSIRKLSATPWSRQKMMELPFQLPTSFRTAL